MSWNESICTQGIPKLIGKNDKPHFVETEVEIYEDDQLTDLYRVCSLYHRMLYDFLLMTGFREQEAMHVTWENIRFGANIVEMRWNQLTQVSGMFRTNVSSATLPQSQSLESVLLSRSASNVPSVSSQFQNAYGVVMAQNAVSPQVRNMTDMTDAQAQDAMKRAIEIDALADAELA